MAFTALLTIDDLGEDYEDVQVHHCEFEFTTRIDVKTGHVLSKPQAGLIHIMIDATRSAALLDWLLRNELKDGKVVFKGDTVQGSMNSKKLIFKKARCVDYREVFESLTGKAMRCHFSIWCQEIAVGDSEIYTVVWNDE